MKKLFLLSLLFISSYAHADVVCNVDISDYGAVYQANQYTCNNGYYLPANATACAACPNGATCNGGTYSFNPTKFQGAQINTIATTMNNVCADNFPTELSAVYEVNTINITWQREDGTTLTTNSCTYGGAVTIPEAPHKTGYRFTGWTVVGQ